MANTCTISDDLIAQFRKFKLGRDVANVAFLMKIDKDSLEVVVDTIEHDIEADELPDLLPAATPRYLAYSYKYVHKEGQHERVSYPLVFIFYCPPGINPSLNMMYASTKQRLANALQIQKLFDVRNPDEFNEEWLKKKLSFFG